MYKATEDKPSAIRPWILSFPLFWSSMWSMGGWGDWKLYNDVFGWEIHTKSVCMRSEHLFCIGKCHESLNCYEYEQESKNFLHLRMQ